MVCRKLRKESPVTFRRMLTWASIKHGISSIDHMSVSAQRAILEEYLEEEHMRGISKIWRWDHGGFDYKNFMLSGSRDFKSTSIHNNHDAAIYNHFIQLELTRH